MDVEDLQRNLQNIKASISNKLNERQRYLDKANEIEQVYNRLLRQKQTVKKYQSDINVFCGKDYGDFRGNNFKCKYKPSTQDLKDAYNSVISRIDVNLDALNNKVMEYRNKASNCLGILGSLESAYNSVKTQIQNWTN